MNIAKKYSLVLVQFAFFTKADRFWGIELELNESRFLEH